MANHFSPKTSGKPLSPASSVNFHTEPNLVDEEKVEQSFKRDTIQTPEQPQNEHIYNRFTWVLLCVALYIMSFLYGLDNTIVADLQGDIVQEFGEVEKLGWLGIGFGLGSVATILSQSKAYGQFDIKWLYIWGIIMFEAGSALCGGAPSMNALIVGRIWAGAGGAGMYLGVLNIFSYTTSMKERPLYLAATGLTYGVGCVIGGAFTDSKASWRWAFYINLVIAAVCAPVYLVVLKSMKPQPNRTVVEKLKQMDWVGVLLNAATYSFFVLAFTFGGAEWAWNAGGTITFIVLFLVTVVVYAVQQGFAIFTTKENRLFPVDFLKHRTMWLLFIGTACGSTAFFIPLYYIPLYYQFVYAESGIQSAVHLLPLIFVTVFVFMANGGLLPVFGYYMPWYVAAGAFQIIFGAVFYACVDANTSNSAIYGFSILAAFGAGLAQQSSYSVATVKAGLNRAADAVGFINVAQIGSSMIGLTITSAVFQNVGYNNLQNALAGQGFTSEDIHAALGGQKSRIFLSASPEVRALALDAIVKAISDGYILVIAGGALALTSALFMKREKLSFDVGMTGNAELLKRIERLEAVILQPPAVKTHVKHASGDSNHTRRQALTPSPEGVVVSDIHQNRDEDSQLLENIGTREDSLLPSLSHGLAFRITSTHEILETRTSVQYPTPASGYDRSDDAIVTFPDYRVAVLLFQSYESNVDHVCRILHIPTVRSLIKTFYLRLNQSEDILPGQAALLLSIFALAAFFYPSSKNSEVATNEQDSVHLSKVLSKGALDVLDYSRRSTSGTLEDIQACILMSFVTFHLDGFSARGRLLLVAAASIARDLRLHRLDADTEFPAEKMNSVRVMIDREVKRRVFWYIASTDWLLSTISGPQEGMYFIHPNHVNVRLPRDCNDDDVVMGEGDELITGNEPTGMTYFLERVRLAYLCREMNDIVPLEISKLKQMPYEHIITLDKKMVGFISSLPFFFRLDAESRKQTKPLEAMYPNIPLLRYCITRAAYSRRCKLHQRWMLRQSSDPRYAYSRRACLESARAVIQFDEGLPGYESPWIVMARMGIAIHFMHLALVVLVMDLCFNRDEADEAEIKAEVRAALQMFEDTRGASPLLGRFLSSLRDILRKHKVYLTDPMTSTTNQVANFVNETNTDAFNPPDDDQMQFTQLGMDAHDPGANLDTSFDEFWQSVIQSEPNLDLHAWDDLFSALDTRPL
ncbi:hypothetical protein MMC17_009208 [Xylographa soralifera]|nr:hypothetical protein [Xylographa soralifera]